MEEDFSPNQEPNLSVDFPKAIFLCHCIRDNKKFEFEGHELGLEFLLREAKRTYEHCTQKENHHAKDWLKRILRDYKKECKKQIKKTPYEADLERALFWKGLLESSEQFYLDKNQKVPIKKSFYLVEAIKDYNEMQNPIAIRDLKKSIEKYLTILL